MGLSRVFFFFFANEGLSRVGIKENGIFLDQAKKEISQKDRNKGEDKCDTTIDNVKC